MRVYYKDLKSMEISKSIRTFAEMLLPRFTKYKVLLVNVSMSIDNYDVNDSEHRDLCIVLYRSNNYMFVGSTAEGTSIDLKNGEPLKFHSYHDSCWSDAIDSLINQTAQEMTEHREDKADYHVNTSFTAFGPSLIDGVVAVNSTDRVAHFNRIPAGSIESYINKKNIFIDVKPVFNMPKNETGWGFDVVGINERALSSSKEYLIPHLWSRSTWTGKCVLVSETATYKLPFKNYNAALNAAIQYCHYHNIE
jgi:hypothetical protein